MDNQPLSHWMELKDLKKWFPVKTGLLAARSKAGDGQFVKAVDGVSLTFERGQVVGIAGGSGSGKSTLAMTVLDLYAPTSGSILFEGRDVKQMSAAEKKGFRRQAQIVFQDPYSSLNPRFTVLRTIIEPLIVHGIGDYAERLERVKRSLELVELVPPESFLPRFPHELSGGQMQRVCVARAMVLDPKILVADEPVSMLDVSIRAGVLELLRSLVTNLNLSILYISHDLAGMAYLCDTIHIMYRGRIIESGPARVIVNRPFHPYTQVLVASVPTMEAGTGRERGRFIGEAHGTSGLLRGCRFRMHCHEALAICAEQEPELHDTEQGRRVACYLL